MSTSASITPPPLVVDLLKNKQLFQEQAFINGVYTPSKSHKTYSVIDPGNNTIIGQMAHCSGVDAAEAIVYASNAGDNWSKLQPHERAFAVGKLGKLMMQHQEDFATLVSLESGKPYKEALGEVAYANQFFQYYADHGADLLRPEVLQAATPALPTTIIAEKVPVGVVTMILPWNFPIAMIARKMAPALCAGNSVVAKASELTPYSQNALGVLAAEAGIPPGVINFVSGDAAAIGHEFTTHPLSRKLTFTGSTTTGSLLLKQSAPGMKNVSLELGGNAPFIVDRTANLELAAGQLLGAKLRNAGQACVAAQRVFVHHNVVEEFSKLMVQKFEQLKMGWSLDEGVCVGPLINEAGVVKVQEHVADAIAKGAKLLTGGKRVSITSKHGTGDLFFEPTILAGCTPEMKLFREEVFGPVFPLFEFSCQQEVVRLSNETPYGLAAYVFGDDDFTTSVARQLHYGMIAVNQGSVSTAVAPFGGVKSSGTRDREGGRQGMEPYYEVKAIHYYSPEAAKMAQPAKL